MILRYSTKKRTRKSHTIRINSQDVRMTFGIVKYAILLMKMRKREATKGIELQNQESIRKHPEKYKYLVIGRNDNKRKTTETKEKDKKKEVHQ